MSPSLPPRQSPTSLPSSIHLMAPASSPACRGSWPTWALSSTYSHHDTVDNSETQNCYELCTCTNTTSAPLHLLATGVMEVEGHGLHPGVVSVPRVVHITPEHHIYIVVETSGWTCRPPPLPGRRCPPWRSGKPHCPGSRR